jgi:formylglycine-generating enzyme required for sulfatase activity
VLAAACVLFTAAAVAGGAWWQRERMKPPPAPLFLHSSTATTAQPWVNSLGMKFVPVPETKVLFSVWETRRRDFEPYRAADRGSFSAWREDQARIVRLMDERISTMDASGQLTHEATWENPGIALTPDHPAGGIHIRDAQLFCVWLTWRERSEGRLPPGWRYRLPTTAEWLTAAGGESAEPRFGNVAGAEVIGHPRWPAGRPHLARRDEHPFLAPVASFPAEPHGLHDLSGNVTEWVLDADESTHFLPRRSAAQLRGPCCTDGTPETTGFDYVRNPMRQLRVANFGFRVVLERTE